MGFHNLLECNVRFTCELYVKLCPIYLNNTFKFPIHNSLICFKCGLIYYSRILFVSTMCFDPSYLHSFNTSQICSINCALLPTSCSLIFSQILLCPISPAYMRKDLDLFTGTQTRSTFLPMKIWVNT